MHILYCGAAGILITGLSIMTMGAESTSPNARRPAMMWIDGEYFEPLILWSFSDYIMILQFNIEKMARHD